jgi:GDP-D-mannose 3', 5'-epimerase
MKKTDIVVVCGAGGFIGGHLVNRLRKEGYTSIRALDCKPLSRWGQIFDDVDNQVKDLRLLPECYLGLQKGKHVFNFACDESSTELNGSPALLGVLINTHLLMAARDLAIENFLFSSSSISQGFKCLEKTFSEQLCKNFRKDFNLKTKIARYSNVYGPFGSTGYDDFRTSGNIENIEKLIALTCRKVAITKMTGQFYFELKVKRTEEYRVTFVDDAIDDTLAMMHNEGVNKAIEIGPQESVAVEALVNLVAQVAGVNIEVAYLAESLGEKGVLDRSIFRYPGSQQSNVSVRAAKAIELTYAWIEAFVMEGATLEGFQTSQNQQAPVFTVVAD